MGQIERVVSLFAVQTAIYWKNNGANGTGGYNFDTPIDIKVRWDGKSELKMNPRGEYYQSSASILTNHEIRVSDYLMLGSIANYTPEQLSDPVALDDAHTVRQLDKIPMVLQTDDFVRTAYLADRS